MKTIIFRRLTLVFLFLCIALSYGCTHQVNKDVWNKGSEVQSFLFVHQLLTTGNRVSIIVVPGQIHAHGTNQEVSADEIGRKIAAHTERQWLKAFGKRENFSLVNRSYLKSQIVQELSLMRSGLISESTRIELGELTGATHLIVADISINSSLGYTEYTIFWNFIDIKSGRVLAIDECSGSYLKLI